MSAESSGGAAPATLVLTSGGTVTAWSTGAERLFGLAAQQAIGCDVRALLGGRVDARVIDEALATAVEGRSWHGLLHVETAAVPDLSVVAEALTADTAVTSIVVTAVPQRPGGVDLINEAGRRVGTTLDLGRTAEEIIEVTVPQFADGGVVYILERTLADEQAPGREADGSIVVRRLAIGLAADDPREWAGIFPVDEVIVYGPETPYARCMTSGRPVLSDSTDVYAVVAQRTGRRLEALLDHTSVLAVPLTARGQTLGFMLLSRKRGRLPFSSMDTRFATELGGIAATRIDNARLYRREHRTAVALQHSLYPARITVPPGLEIAHRYLPAGSAAQVGGDWYDVVPLSDGRVALVIGDAMGHGVTAAAAMGQLRVAAHTLASLNLTPTEILRRLDRIARDLDAAQFATCICVICDPVAQSCTIAGAGHPPALLADPGGGSRVLRYLPGLPLGTGDAHSESGFPATEVAFPPGATLVLYTDGLIESRTEDLDTGIAALQAAIEPDPPSLEAVADGLLKGLRDRIGADDVALMLVRPK